MPYTCDATLPAAERYRSLTFRRYAGSLYLDRLDYADAQLLGAFMGTVGLKPCRWIFHWCGPAQRNAAKLLPAMLQDAEVLRAIEANRAAYTRDEGLAVLRAMQDGGFTRGPVPEIVRMAFLDMLDAGMSRAAVGEAVGLTLDQVQVMAHGPRRVHAAVPLSSAAIFAQ